MVWGYKDKEKGGVTQALFMLEDLYEPLVPVYFAVKDVESALFSLVSNLMLHLFHSVLAPEDIADLYGRLRRVVKAPISDNISLPPDADLLESLKTVCNNLHTELLTRKP